MKSSYIPILCLIISIVIFENVKADSFQFSKNETPVKVLFHKSTTIVVTNGGLYLVVKNELKSILTTTIQINDALVVKDKIWLASDSGFYCYALGNKKAVKIDVPLAAKDPKVAQLSKDGSNIWVGTTWNGSFLYYPIKDTLIKYFDVSPLFAVSASIDSSVWFGTSVGMYRFLKKSNTFQRYAEEGYSGLELPDNIVQNLFVDKNGNVWVIMTDGVAFKAVNNIEGHLPTFNYVGKRDNVVTDVEYMDKGNYLFATTDGLIFLPNAPEEEHSHAGEEINSHGDTKAFLVDKLEIGAPITLANETVFSIDRDSKGYLWFTTAKGVWNAKAVKFKKLKRPFVAKK